MWFLGLIQNSQKRFQTLWSKRLTLFLNSKIFLHFSYSVQKNFVILKKLKRNRGASDSGWRNEYLITLLQLSDQDLGSVVIPFFTFLASLHAHSRSSLLECFSLVRIIPLLKKVGEDSVRPIGVTEPLFEVIGLCWLHKLKDKALKLFCGHQFGMSSAGAEALSRAFQMDIEDFHMQFWVKNTRFF